MTPEVVRNCQLMHKRPSKKQREEPSEPQRRTWLGRQEAQVGRQAPAKLARSLRSLDTWAAAGGSFCLHFVAHCCLLCWGLNDGGVMTTGWMDVSLLISLPPSCLSPPNNLAVSGGRLHTFQRNRGELQWAFCSFFEFCGAKEESALFVSSPFPAW